MNRNEEIEELYCKGFSYKEIADKFGISRQRVHQLIRPDPVTYRYVKLRANDCCEECGVKVRSGHVHHLDCPDPEKMNDIQNLRYLCVSCHMKRHGIDRRQEEMAEIAKSLQSAPRPLRCTAVKKKREKSEHDYKDNKLKVDGVKMTAARIAASLSGAEVARRLGCNKGSVCKWEMNHLIPSEERLFRLIEMFGTADFLDWNSVGLDRLAELGEKVKQHLKEGKK